jgi:hypothetical protein
MQSARRNADFSFFANRVDKVIEGFIQPCDTDGPQPVGNGFSAFGKNNSVKIVLKYCCDESALRLAEESPRTWLGKCF